MNPIRLGIVGAEAFAESVHRPIIEAQPDHFQIVAIYDPNPSRGLSWASRVNAAAYESLDDLLANRQIEAVFITGHPITTRFEYAQRALNAGFVVVLDRPMAASAAQCDELIQLARRRGVLLTASHLRRWDYPFVHARSRIESGEIGEVRLIKLAGMTTPGEDAAFGDGFDLLDFALLLNESPLLEVAAAPQSRREPLDTVTVQCRFEEPPAIEVSFCALAPGVALPLPRLAAFGTRGSFADTSLMADPNPQPFYDGLWSAIRERGAAPVVAASARNAVYLAECVLESARQGRAIRAERLLKAVE